VVVDKAGCLDTFRKNYEIDKYLVEYVTGVVVEAMRPYRLGLVV
jgi:hypothetical protein